MVRRLRSWPHVEPPYSAHYKTPVGATNYLKVEAMVLSIRRSLAAFAAVAIISTKAQSTLPTGWVAIGCYTDSTTSRTLNIAATSDVNNMTIEECITFCTPAGYQFAGVEFGRECYCDNIIESPSVPATDGCNMSCTGNSAEICGGANRINIFNNTAVSHQPPPTPTNPTIKKTVGAFQYKGCFEDGVNGAPRSLQTQVSVAGGVSAETCTAACKAAGFPLAGLEFGQECWCDVYMPLVINTPDSQCNMPCQKDNTEVCGAGNRLAVYQDTSATPPTAGVCLTNVAQFNNPNVPYMFNLTAVPNPGGGAGTQLGIFNLGLNGFTGPQTLYELEVGAAQVRTQHTFNFAVNTFWPSAIGFGVPAALVLQNASAQNFESQPGVTLPPYRQYCVMPNPVGQFGPFIGPGTLAANGRNDLWALCISPGFTQASVVFNPILGGTVTCQFVVFQMDPL